MSPNADKDFPVVASEAIVVVDLVESTKAADLYGWYAVGRGLMRDLRSLIVEIGTPRGLACLKSTGDGYLFTFGNNAAADRAVLAAVETCFLVLDRVYERNREKPEEHSINLRFAMHFGEVAVLESDREGPNVSFTFRLEAVSNESLATALHLTPPEQLPPQNYVLCSEAVKGILSRRSEKWNLSSVGLLKLKGFDGYHEVLRIQEHEREEILLLPEARRFEHPTPAVESFRAFTVRKSRGTLSLWVLVQDFGKGIRLLKNNRYLFACVRTSRHRYKNIFALAHGPAEKKYAPPAEPSWKLWLANEDGSGRTWAYPDNERFAPGWHLFVVRWNHEANHLELLIDGESCIKESKYLQYWPTGRADHAHIGYWPGQADYHFANTLLARVRLVHAFVDDDWIKRELANQPLQVR